MLQSGEELNKRMQEFHWALMIFVTGAIVTTATVVMIAQGHHRYASEQPSRHE
jgi:hypothetical protein